jgi:transposase InsO family protein
LTLWKLSGAGFCTFMWHHLSVRKIIMPRKPQTDAGFGRALRADHTQKFDLWAKRDDGQIARPWLNVIIDDYSRAIAGDLFSFESPSAAQTALALRQAIWRKSEAHWIIFGIPEALCTDNGSDFTSAYLEQAAADIKMRLICSTPGQSCSRCRIERFFATVRQMFLCTLFGSIESPAVRDQPGPDTHRSRLSFSRLPAQIPYPSAR